jgi:Na+-transporting NADH:ubiquinone oxidoreductase subunit NqrB
METIFRGPLRDARWFQIAGQSIILSIGLLFYGFGVSPAQIAAALIAALAAQWIGARLIASRFDWKSALISGLSLALLLRANDWPPFALAAALAIGSKFAIRADGRHIFNPANFAIVAMLLAGGAWTSTSEWGSAPWFALTIAALGLVSTWRASRLDAPIVYLGVYGALLLGRALYLGDPLAIPALRLSHGALILFAFFMISDPKTTPDDLKERALFVGAAALVAYVLQFHFHISDGIFYAPFLLALLRLAIGAPQRGRPYEWGRAPLNPFASPRRAAAPAE